jgi:hypothetical protein
MKCEDRYLARALYDAAMKSHYRRYVSIQLSIVLHYIASCSIYFIYLHGFHYICTWWVHRLRIFLVFVAVCYLQVFLDGLYTYIGHN